jgi:hypothetical protein
VKQVELLQHVIKILEDQDINYILVGSFASFAYGEPRLTQDIDLVVQLRVDQVADLCAAFPAPEYYLSREAVEDAVRQRGQFNVIHPSSGNKIDFMMARDDAWGRSQFARRRRLLIVPDCEGYTAAPEDVILGKLWYYAEGGSEKHVRDIAGILRLSGEQVDQAYVTQWATTLGVHDVWQGILERLKAAP